MAQAGRIDSECRALYQDAWNGFSLMIAERWCNARRMAHAVAWTACHVCPLACNRSREHTLHVVSGSSPGKTILLWLSPDGLTASVVPFQEA